MGDRSCVRRWPRDIIAILSALAALLIYFQFTTLYKFAVLAPAKRYGSFSIFLAVVKQRVQLDIADAISAGMIVATIVAIIVLELWKKRLTAFLNKVFETENRTLVLILLLCLFSSRYYFATGGLAWAGDASFHIGYAWIASQAFSQGEIPVWTNYFGTGSPYCQFYGFLFFFLTGAVNLLFSDLQFSLKFVMGASHVISGVGMYLFVRTLFNRQAGLVAAMAFVMCVWHTQHVLIMGRYPISLFYALLPFPFYFFESLRVRTRGLAYAIGGGLTLGLLAFTHPGYAFWATALLGLYVCIRLLSDKGRRDARALYGNSLLLLLGGVALGAYLTLPMWLEREHVRLYRGFDLSSWPDPTLGQLLVWSNYRFRLFLIDANHWYGGYLGLSLIVLSIAGLTGTVLFRWWRGGMRESEFMNQAGLKLPAGEDLPSKSWPAVACLVVCLFLVFGYRWPLGSVSIVQAFAAVRFLLFVVFFLAVMAGAGTVALLHFLGGRKTHVDVFTVILFIVAVDLGPATFQQPYIAYDALERPALIGKKGTDLLRSEAGGLPDGEIPNFRIYYATDTDHHPLTVSYLSVKTRIPTILGLFDESPVAEDVFCRPLEISLNSAIRKAEIQQSASMQHSFGLLNDALHLANVRRVIARRTDVRELMMWRIPSVGPVVVSSRITGLGLLPPRKNTGIDRQAAFLRLVEQMGVNQEKNTCEQILLATPEGTEDLGTDPSVQVLEHRVWNQRVEMVIRTSDSCFARLAYAYYPYLSVTVNGNRVAPYQTAGSFIALRLSEGEHRIVLEPVLSPLRRVMLGLSLAIVAAWLSYFGWRIRYVWPVRYFFNCKRRKQ